MAKFCESCGAPLGDNAKFCGNCGAKVEVIAGSSDVPKTEESIKEASVSLNIVPMAAITEEPENAVEVNDEKLHSAKNEEKSEGGGLEKKSDEAHSVKMTDDYKNEKASRDNKSSEEINSKRPQPAHHKSVWDDIEKPKASEEKKKSKTQLIPIISSICLVLAIGAAVAIKMNLFGNNGNNPKGGSETAIVETDKPEESSDAESAEKTQDESAETKETETPEESVEEVKASIVMETEASKEEKSLVLQAEKHETGNGPIGYVDVKTARIRVRKGPSTSSTDTKKRTAVGDKYEVYEKTTGEGYNWYRISNNNEWIADNNGKWMKFTAYETTAPELVKPQAVAGSYYDIYLSYLDSINHNGDFSYLKNTSENQLEAFRKNYAELTKNYKFENTEFAVDLTDIQIAETKNGYDAIVHAYVVNTSTDLNSGEKQENEVKLLARLSYKDDSGKWTLTWQRSDSEYDQTGHEMYSCK